MVGYWSEILIASGYLFAMLALMVPLSKNFYRGAFLAYLGTVVLAIVMGAAAHFWELVPFVMFFGLHPLLNALQIKFNINKWIAVAVKAVWFDFTLWVAYILIFHSVLGGDSANTPFFKFINDYALVFIFVGGTLIFGFYDFVIFRCQRIVNRLVYRIRK